MDLKKEYERYEKLYRSFNTPYDSWEWMTRSGSTYSYNSWQGTFWKGNAMIMEQVWDLFFPFGESNFAPLILGKSPSGREMILKTNAVVRYTNNDWERAQGSLGPRWVAK